MAESPTVALVPLAALHPAPWNPRTIRDERFKNLCDSIQSDPAFIWRRPILAQLDGTIYAGNMRYRAAEHLGMAEVPAIVEDVPDTLAKERALRDNAQWGDWQDDELARLLAELQDAESNLDLLGIEEADLKKLLAGPKVERTDPDAVPPTPDEPTTKPGDLWLLGEHRLLCGDATKAEDVARLMDGERPKIAVTSPPYNQHIDQFAPSGMHREGDWVGKVQRLAYPDSVNEDTYQSQQIAALETWHEFMADESSFFYNHKNRYREKEVVSPLLWLPGPFRLRQEIIWSRPGSVTQNARMFLPSDERIYWLYKGDDFYFDATTEIKSYSTVWDIGLEVNKSHAVAFPIELPSRCIEACSRQGDVVFEPYCGSGTTLIACERLGRRCYAIEIEPRYVDVAVRRWEEFTGKKAVLDAAAD